MFFSSTVLLNELPVVFLQPYFSHRGGSIGRPPPHNKRQNGERGQRCGGKAPPSH
jgi:hypothetical protein